MFARGAIASLLVVGLLLAGCGSAAVPGDAARIDPELVADLGPGEAKAVGDALNTFGFELLAEVTDGDEMGDRPEGQGGGKNAVTSPLSVAVLLAMVLAGAGGDTADAMAEVLHLDDPRDVRVGALLGRLADTDDVTLSVTSALWADDGTPFEEDYLTFVADTFGATVEEADLGAQQTADEIDAWVDERTDGLIKELAADLNLPNPQAVLVLVNAVYFLGEWTTQFDPSDTRDRPFALPDGSRVQVPLMHLREHEFGYAERDGYRMLRLPYGETGRYGMEVLLPDEGVGLGAVLDSLDAAEWRAAVGSLTERTVGELALPRFELEWEAELNDPLSRLGMGTAFGPAADFRPMSQADPWLDVVAHKTYIKVDEKGTEAAAVTGGGMATSAIPDQLEFLVDRPFAFTISDIETGAICFLGAVADPRG